MIEKKDRDLGLEQLRAPLFFLGLLLSSAFVLTAFEWKTFSEVTPLSDRDRSLALPDETIFTAVPMAMPLPPPPAPKPVIDVIDIIPNDKIINIGIEMPDINFKDEPAITEISLKAEVITEEVLDLALIDEWPSFPGGDTARVKYLAENTIYPPMAVRSNTQGTVWVEFVVDKNGDIQDATVIRGIGAGCDEELLRVVNEMPKWTPGKQRGRPVKVRFKLPIKYTLRN